MKASNLEDVKSHQHILFMAVLISPPSTPIIYCTTTRTQTQTTILSEKGISQPRDAQATSEPLQNHLQEYFANSQHLYLTNFLPIGFHKDMLSSNSKTRPSVEQSNNGNLRVRFSTPRQKLLFIHPCIGLRHHHHYQHPPKKKISSEMPRMSAAAGSEAV